MPFIPKEDRPSLLNGYRMAETPGEECFLAYVELMKRWKETPRWRTIDQMAKDLFKLNPKQAAEFLAFLVFFIQHGMKYEKKQQKANGDI